MSVARKAIIRAAVAGAVAGVVVVTALRLTGALSLMPLDWVIAAWTGAATLGLVAAVRQLRQLGSPALPAPPGGPRPPAADGGGTS